MASVLNGLFLFLQGHFSLHLELTQETKRIRLKISCLVTCAERHSHRFWGQDLEISLKWPIHPLYQARAHSGPSLQPRPHQHLDFRAIHVGAEPPGMGVPSTSHWGVALSPSVFSLLLPPSTAGFRCGGSSGHVAPPPHTHSSLISILSHLSGAGVEGFPTFLCCRGAPFMKHGLLCPLWLIISLKVKYHRPDSFF